MTLAPGISTRGSYGNGSEGDGVRLLGAWRGDGQTLWRPVRTERGDERKKRSFLLLVLNEKPIAATVEIEIKSHSLSILETNLYSLGRKRKKKNLLPARTNARLTNSSFGHHISIGTLIFPSHSYLSIHPYVVTEPGDHPRATMEPVSRAGYRHTHA